MSGTDSVEWGMRCSDRAGGFMEICYDTEQEARWNVEGADEKHWPATLISRPVGVWVEVTP